MISPNHHIAAPNRSSVGPSVGTEDPFEALQASELTGAIRDSDTLDKTPEKVGILHRIEGIVKDIESGRNIIRLLEPIAERMSQVSLSGLLVPVATLSATIFGTYLAAQLVYDYFSVYNHKEKLRIDLNHESLMNAIKREGNDIEFNHASRMKDLDFNHTSRMKDLDFNHTSRMNPIKREENDIKREGSDIEFNHASRMKLLNNNNQTFGTQTKIQHMTNSED